MNNLTQQTIEKVRLCREALINIPKAELTSKVVNEWLDEWEPVFKRADSITGRAMWVVIDNPFRGFEDETDVEVWLDIRDKVVAIIDENLSLLDSAQAIKPVLEQLILKVKDDKLSTLLKEFNSCRTEQPNFAAAGFRTILPLIIRERAKKVDPTHQLATKDDINFEPDINAAIKHDSLFNQAERKLIKRYISGGDKDSFDNVVHKPAYLIDKNELDDVVDLLNRLLPTIAQ